MIPSQSFVGFGFFFLWGVAWFVCLFFFSDRIFFPSLVFDERLVSYLTLLRHSFSFSWIDSQLIDGNGRNLPGF